MLFGLGNMFVLISVYILLCIAHPIYVCVAMMISCYPEANDVTGGPGDA